MDSCLVSSFGTIVCVGDTSGIIKSTANLESEIEVVGPICSVDNGRSHMTSDSDNSLKRAKDDGRRLRSVYQVALQLAAIFMVSGQLPPRVNEGITLWLWCDLAIFAVMVLVGGSMWVYKREIKAMPISEFASIFMASVRARPIRHIILPVFLFAIYYDGREIMFYSYLILFVVSEYLIVQRVKLECRGGQRQGNGRGDDLRNRHS